MKRMRVTYPSHQEPAASPFEFQWEVAEGGYQWVNAIPAGPHDRSREAAPFLTDRRGVGTPYEAWRYSPLRRDPGLFRSFADLEPTTEAIQAFANEYGPLGGDSSSMIAIPQTADRAGALKFDIGGNSTYFVAHGETLAVWAHQISDMRAAVELWLAATRDAPSLVKRIFWRGDRVTYEWARSWSVIASVHMNPEVFRRFKRGDLVGPALYHLQDRVNDRLKDRVGARLLWDRSYDQLGIHLVPRSLIGALWLQFARAIEGQRRYLRCDACGRWLEISPDVRRSDARHCSGTCRTRAYRARRRAGTPNSVVPVSGSPNREDGKSHGPTSRSKRSGRRD